MWMLTLMIKWYVNVQKQIPKKVFEEMKYEIKPHLS